MSSSIIQNISRNYCRHVAAHEGRENQRGSCPSGRPSQRVEELEESDIFPPQVTRAAYQAENRGPAVPMEERCLPPWKRARRPSQAFVYTGRRSELWGAFARWREEGDGFLRERVCLLPLREGGARSRFFSGLEPEAVQGREDRPHRLQRRGQIHPDEADGRALKALGWEGAC